MGDYNYPQGLYLSPDQQDLLRAALSSNNPQPKQEPDTTPNLAATASYNASPNGLNHSSNGSSGYINGLDESPFVDFNPDADFDFHGSESLIGDLPGGVADDYELGDKRKDTDPDHEESGKKRRESDEKIARKPGRKPLTSEPTTVCGVCVGSVHANPPRNARPRTVRLNERSVSGRNNI